MAFAHHDYHVRWSPTFSNNRIHLPASIGHPRASLVVACHQRVRVGLVFYTDELLTIGSFHSLGIACGLSR